MISKIWGSIGLSFLFTGLASFVASFLVVYLVGIETYSRVKSDYDVKQLKPYIWRFVDSENCFKPDEGWIDSRKFSIKRGPNWGLVHVNNPETGGFKLLMVTSSMYFVQEEFNSCWRSSMKSGR